MNDRAEARSILRESAVIVFVNSIAGGGRARSYLAQIQKLFESAQVHAQFVMTNSAAELELSMRHSGPTCSWVSSPSEEEMISPPRSGCRAIP